MAEIEWYGYVLPVAGGVIGGIGGKRMVRKPGLAILLGYIGGTILGIWVSSKIKARAGSSPVKLSKSCKSCRKSIAGE